MSPVLIEFPNEKVSPVIFNLDGTFDYADFFHEVGASKIVVISDENVWKIYSKRFCDFDNEVILEPGEQTKSIRGYEYLTTSLAKLDIDRNVLIVGIGGGVVCDLVGFVASTFKRGVKFCFIATSLMAQVDAAIGGKCGIDLPEGKNLLGRFALPEAVVCDIPTLETLPERELKNGLAEVIKYGFISNPELLDQVSIDLQAAGKFVPICAEIKAKFVNADPFETKGIRSALNFGHTVGHAIEQAMNYDGILHGEAVAVGMIVEARIGENLGKTPLGTADRVRDVVAGCGIPTQLPENLNFEKMMRSMANDKKNINGKLSMSLLTGVGSCELSHDIPREIINEVIQKA